ncbi:uncharacterized protein F4817DRAFT_337304 [Daldinia loculata]|uniref:uncharacterized protein n=1 Tax=Daldinia loculata TaxID=103429 RepID=UPI0020C27C08|nr:uncharacterized protein F4817DRAFT_337304 [Daldinia loculata]KAI1647345.1 hypothetical protein F4817DRAFT_337304 [Daldinia loculata]
MAAPESLQKGASFWLVIVSLCLIAFTSSLDGSILAIALPQVSSSLNIADKYVRGCMGYAPDCRRAGSCNDPSYNTSCDLSKPTRERCHRSYRGVFISTWLWLCLGNYNSGNHIQQSF